MMFHHEKESARKWMIFVFVMMIERGNMSRGYRAKSLPSFEEFPLQRNLEKTSPIVRRGIGVVLYTPKHLSEWRGNLLRDDTLKEHDSVFRKNFFKVNFSESFLDHYNTLFH